MNYAHSVICSSGFWARSVENKLLPWGLKDVELGEDVLEIGPGFGATSSVLAKRPGSLTVLELDDGYCEHLRRELDSSVSVIQGDATKMEFNDDQFSGIVCFTMLHHLPSVASQNKLLAEASRVLRPGGVFAGTDNLGVGALFKLLHVSDTLVPVSPDGLGERLEGAGLVKPNVERGARSFRFQAHKPA